MVKIGDRIVIPGVAAQAATKPPAAMAQTKPAASQRSVIRCSAPAPSTRRRNGDAR